MSGILWNGAPGTVYTNTTGKFLYQFLVNWHNSCGVCIQMDHAVGPSFPIPLHFRCACRQILIRPGGTSQPAVDFRRKIAELDTIQQNRVVGASNYRLIEKGIVQWSDVVTEGRIRDLREVVSLKRLDLKTMVAAGINPRIAMEAESAVNTTAHTIAEASRARLLDALKAKGLSEEQIRRLVGEKLAGRVTVGGKSPPFAAPPQTPMPPPPSGPVKPPAPAPSPAPMPGPPTTPPKPKPTPKPLSPAKIGEALGFDLKSPEQLIAEKAARQQAEIEGQARLKAGAEALAKKAKEKADPTRMETVRSLGGSTGAKLVKDVEGNLFVLKKGANAGHLKEEAYADDAYRSLGLDVPKSTITQTASGPVKLAEFHQGKTLAELRQSNPAAAAKAEAEIRKGFVADALLGNWDVIGLNADNILVTAQGTVLRIDNGGSLRYRAQGAKKQASQFAPEIAELKTLRDAQINPSAARVFGSITDEEIRSQARAILARKAELLASLPAELRGTIGSRLDDLARVAVEPVQAKAVSAVATTPPVKAAKAEARKAHKAFDRTGDMEAWGKDHFQGWAESLSHDEQVAVKNYTGNGFKWMNDLLRGKAGPPGMMSNPYALAQIDASAAAIAKAKIPEDVIAYRGVKNLHAMGFQNGLADLQPGQVFEEPGFSSTSLSKKKGAEFAHPGLGNESAATPSVVFRVVIPKGSTGAYVNAGEFSVYDDERELLLPPKARYRVVGPHGTATHMGMTIPVVALERID